MMTSVTVSIKKPVALGAACWRTPIGTYDVRWRCMGYFVQFNDVDVGTFRTLPEAEAFIQKDFLERATAIMRDCFVINQKVDEINLETHVPIGNFPIVIQDQCGVDDEESVRISRKSAKMLARLADVTWPVFGDEDRQSMDTAFVELSNSLSD